MTKRARVLFLCTHNSARSQMAEAILGDLAGGRFEVESAGTERSRVHPLAIETMARRGIDLTGHRSKHLDELAGQPFDYVVTVCDAANAACPVFPGTAQRLHWSVPDPAAVVGTEQERRAAFERAADELTVRIRALVAASR
jgi:arsenate reductase